LLAGVVGCVAACRLDSTGVTNAAGVAAGSVAAAG
jgi:hypothetical protein